MHKLLHLFLQMGPRYLAFRAWHELQRRSGLLRRRFPEDPPRVEGLPTLDGWRQSRSRFFFARRSELAFPPVPEAQLAEDYRQIREGKLRFFQAEVHPLGTDYDWVTHPGSGYRYDPSRHWTQIADFSAEAGDIKYVWEKARFAYLLTVIRYDHHFGEDSSAFAFSEIEDFIDKNPLNCGPNYRCSQEISLRLMNWLFALFFYRDSQELTPARFDKIMHSFYWQLHHVYQNINFSRIAVRNNHALTETLMLYLGGLLFPGVPAFKKWAQKGKAWFEQEVAYQVYEDGTFLQFSMNYHRVVVQLLSWAIRLSELNGEQLSATVYERARKSLAFLYTCMAPGTGRLPNYGMNDGALFFPLNNLPFRDYRPSLQALAWLLGEKISGPVYEDTLWLSGGRAKAEAAETPVPLGTHAFDAGGYYLLREPETLSFIRCGNHRDRPHQADNLHLDLWHKGVNILRDAGSFLYNTDEATFRYFNGTEGHNTVMVNGHSQMRKGPRFIWYYWTQAFEAQWEETEEGYAFEGAIRAFRQLGKGIVHFRKVEKRKNRPEWRITDRIEGIAEVEMRQIWHPHPAYAAAIKIEAREEGGKPLPLEEEKGWYSSHYGKREEAPQWSFRANKKEISTYISCHENITDPSILSGRG